MRWIRLPVVILVLAAASQAIAQPNQYAYPPYPPSPPPAYLPPLPTHEETDALEHAGRQKIIAGNVLLFTGGGLLLTGTALLVASISVEEHACDSYYHHYYDDGYHGHCASAPLAWAGGMTAFLGVAAIVPGVFVRARGVRELTTARAWRANAWSLRPQVSTHGALAQVSLKF